MENPVHFWYSNISFSVHSDSTPALLTLMFPR
jgi:hypothetical protein